MRLSILLLMASVLMQLSCLCSLVAAYRHPGIVQLRGYSIEPEKAFIAYDMERKCSDVLYRVYAGCSPYSYGAAHVGSFEALSRSVQGVDKLLWILNAVSRGYR